MCTVWKTNTLQLNKVAVLDIPAIEDVLKREGFFLVIEIPGKAVVRLHWLPAPWRPDPYQDWTSTSK